MRLTPKVTVTADFTLTLTEIEARALDDLTGYGVDAFLKAFYDKLGKSYMEKHEVGLRALFKSVPEQLRPVFHYVEQARRDLRDAEKRRQEERDRPATPNPTQDTTP